MTPARILARLIVAALLAVSLLPIANWIPSERSAPWFSEVAAQWAVGGLVVGFGALALTLASRVQTSLWRQGAVGEFLAYLDPARPRIAALIAIGATLLYLGVAVLVFDRRPILIDEIVLLFQAHTYASGRVALPVDPDPAFRSMLHLVEHGGRWFGHFPPGWPLVLALGDLLGAAWAVGPIVGGVMVWAWGRVLARIEPVASVRAGATLLLALAPFPAFMAGSAMNHTATLMWLLLALAGWLRFLERRSLASAIAVGCAFGMAAITRPADAVAFGIPALVWVISDWRGRRLVDRPSSVKSLASVVAMACGAAVPVLGMVAVNVATTGAPLLSGYQLLWGPHVGLGFHEAPYGPPHTVLRGFELVSLYLLRLNVYLFEAPVPGLLAAGFALLLTPRLRSADRYLLASGGLLLGLYFAYWHDGFFLGPRFVYPLAPIVALWTVRLPGLAGVRFGPMGQRAAAFGLALAMVGALAVGIPLRAGRNAGAQLGLRFDADHAAATAGISNAIVFVRESWGSQLLARLWALGASRSAAERFYHGIDTCILDHALTDAEREPGIPLDARLAPLLADSARLLASPFSADTSERAQNGASYDSRCMARIAESRQGTALLAPTLLSRRPDLLFVRDLHERNARLVSADPTKALYLLAKGPADSVPVFRLLSRDSIMGLKR